MKETTIICAERVIGYKINKKRSMELIAGEKITGPETAIKLAKTILQNKPYEEFWVFAFDSDNHLLGAHMVNSGTVNRASINPRNLFSFLFHVNATGCIVAHNHPGGTLDPSREDLSLTRKLTDLGRELGIRVMDHIIVRDTEGVSLRSNGYEDCFNS